MESAMAWTSSQDLHLGTTEQCARCDCNLWPCHWTTGMQPSLLHRALCRQSPAHKSLGRGFCADHRHFPSRVSQKKKKGTVRRLVFQAPMFAAASRLRASPIRNWISALQCRSFRRCGYKLASVASISVKNNPLPFSHSPSASFPRSGSLPPSRFPSPVTRYTASRMPKMP